MKLNLNIELKSIHKDGDNIVTIETDQQNKIVEVLTVIQMARDQLISMVTDDPENEKIILDLKFKDLMK